MYEMGEPGMVQKLTHLTAMLREIEVLKECGMSQNQMKKIREVEDRVLSY